MNLAQVVDDDHFEMVFGVFMERGPLPSQAAMAGGRRSFIALVPEPRSVAARWNPVE